MQSRLSLFCKESACRLLGLFEWFLRIPVSDRKCAERYLAKSFSHDPFRLSH